MNLRSSAVALERDARVPKHNCYISKKGRPTLVDEIPILKKLNMTMAAKRPSTLIGVLFVDGNIKAPISMIAHAPYTNKQTAPTASQKKSLPTRASFTTEQLGTREEICVSRICK